MPFSYLNNNRVPSEKSLKNFSWGEGRQIDFINKNNKGICAYLTFYYKNEKEGWDNSFFEISMYNGNANKINETRYEKYGDARQKFIETRDAIHDAIQNEYLSFV